MFSQFTVFEKCENIDNVKLTQSQTMALIESWNPRNANWPTLYTLEIFQFSQIGENVHTQS